MKYLPPAQVHRGFPRALACVLLVGMACDVRSPMSSATDRIPTAEHRRPTISAESAFGFLRRDSEFASAAVGYAGTPSVEARALHRVLRDPQHAELLQALWREGTAAGRLYALVGFALVDSAAFRNNIATVTNDTTMIPTMIGCIVESRRIGSLARGIQGEFADEFRPDSNSERIDALIDSLEARRVRPR